MSNVNASFSVTPAVPRTVMVVVKIYIPFALIIPNVSLLLANVVALLLSLMTKVPSMVAACPVLVT